MLITLETTNALATLPRYLAVLGVAIAGFLVVPDMERVLFQPHECDFHSAVLLVGSWGKSPTGAFPRTPWALLRCWYWWSAWVPGYRMSMDPTTRFSDGLRSLWPSECLLPFASPGGCRIRQLRFIGYSSFCIYLYHAMFLNDVRRLSHGLPCLAPGPVSLAGRCRLGGAGGDRPFGASEPIRAAGFWVNGRSSGAAKPLKTRRRAAPSQERNVGATLELSP